MRPKKVVLLVDHNETELSRMRFLLETRGFRVIGCASGAGALERLAQDALEPPAIGVRIDLLAAVLEPRDGYGNTLARRAKDVQFWLPVLLFSRTCRAAEEAGGLNAADGFLPAGFTAAEFLERVRVMCARKRGPRKDQQQIPGGDDRKKDKRRFPSGMTTQEGMTTKEGMTKKDEGGGGLIFVWGYLVLGLMVVLADYAYARWCGRLPHVPWNALLLVGLLLVVVWPLGVWEWWFVERRR